FGEFSWQRFSKLSGSGLILGSSLSIRSGLITACSGLSKPLASGLFNFKWRFVQVLASGLIIDCSSLSKELASGLIKEAEIKQMEADDQEIHIILSGLLEDIYAAVDRCETT
nr:hypothetical protein [Tanacetum cinerariifolium]